MAFNLFKPFVFIARNLNASFDYVQADRFIRERREQRRLKRSSYGTVSDVLKFKEDKTVNDSSISNPAKENIFVEFKKAIEYVLEYNQSGYLHLLLITSHIMILITQMVVWTLYSLLPWDRNPATNKYEDSALRFIESVFMFNVFEDFQKGRIMSRMLALLWCQYSLLRLRSLYRIVNNAKINRHHYKRINIVQINMGCASEIRADLNGWLRFLFNNRMHKCKSGLSLETGQGIMMKALSSRLKKGFHKIDQLYYFNQIDFENCFAIQKFYQSSIRDQDSNPANHLQMNSKAQPQTDVDHREKAEVKPRSNLLTTWNKLRASFVIEKAAHRPYVPRPEHTVDWTHFRILAIIYLTTTSMTVVLLSITFGAMVLSEFDRARSLDQCTSIGTLGCLLQPNLLLRSALSFWGLCVLAINAYDNSLMAYSSTLCHSRSDKVVRMLERENQFHRKLLRGFCVYLDASGVSLDEPDLEPTDEDDDDDDNDDDAKKEPETDQFEEPSVLRSHSVAGTNNLAAQYKRDFKDIHSYASRMRTYNRCPISMKSKLVKPQHRRSAFDSTLAAYKADLKIGNRLCEFNENIVYLMDLVGVLQSEFSDMKDFFTTPIDLNILFGIVTSSMAINLLMSFTTMVDLALYVSTSILTIAPLIYTLFIGATSERSFRQVYRALIPSMINQLGFVEMKSVRRLQKLCGHLAIKKNRSFVMLGNFPLTFGSMTSILAWIATGNALLQGFYYNGSR